MRWSAERLAQEARLGVATVRRADATDGELQITAANAHAIQAALEKVGIEFIEGGVRERPGIHLARLKGDAVRKQIDADNEGRIPSDD